MRWLKRLSAVRVNRQKFYASGAESAGDAAEEAVYDAVVKVLEGRKNTKHWRVWEAVRVRHGTWRSEIDLLVWTDDRLYLIELKNWSGRLDVQNNELVQFRRHQGGMVAHGNLMKKMRRREEAVRAWLKQHQAEIPRIERKILFYNPRLEFTDAVFDYLKGEVMSASMWHAELRERARQAKGEKISAKRRAGFDAISSLSTWDTVEMHGGRIVRGDIRSSTETLPMEKGAPLRLHDRKRIERLDIQAPRSYLRAAFVDEMDLQLTVHLRTGEQLIAHVPIETTMRVHAAGQRKTELVALRHVRTLRFGGT